MQEIVNKKETVNRFNMDDLPLEEKQRLVDAFAWLIQEDKKQNPELYQLKQQEND